MEATVLHQKATLTVALQAALKEAVKVMEGRKRHQVIVMVVVEAGATVITIQVMVGVVMEVGVMEAHHIPPHQEVAVVIMMVAVVTAVIPHLGIGHHRNGIVTNARIRDSLILMQIAKDGSHLQHHLLFFLLQGASQTNGIMVLDGGRRKSRQVATRGLLTQAHTALL
jgi:hypothetical protein